MAHHNARPSRYSAQRWLGVLLLFCCLQGSADSSLRLKKLKAAYVFNFLKFTIWPLEGARDMPLFVCATVMPCCNKPSSHCKASR